MDMVEMNSPPHKDCSAHHRRRSEPSHLDGYLPSGLIEITHGARSYAVGISTPAKGLRQLAEPQEDSLRERACANLRTLPTRRSRSENFYSLDLLASPSAPRGGPGVSMRTRAGTRRGPDKLPDVRCARPFVE